MGTHPIFESDFDCLTEPQRLKMRILVTGASGFLGRNLVQFLEEANHEVIPIYGKNKIKNGFQLDLLDREQVDKLVLSSKADCCVHAAACCNVAQVGADPVRARKVNVDSSIYLGKPNSLIVLILAEFYQFNPNRYFT